jgi:hypothetical protein
MPARPTVRQLPVGIRAWLDNELRERGFADYEAVTELLNAKLREHYARESFESVAPTAVEGVGKSSVHRYGQALQRRIERIIASTEAAQLIADAAPDEQAAQSGAVISMVQGDLFEVLMQVQEADAETEPTERLKLLGNAAKAIADLSHAAIRQKKYAGEVRRRLDAAKEAAAERSEQIARKAGLSEADWGAIRANILGIEVAE